MNVFRSTHKSGSDIKPSFVTISDNLGTPKVVFELILGGSLDVFLAIHANFLFSSSFTCPWLTYLVAQLKQNNGDLM